MDDDFGADAALLEAMASADTAPPPRPKVTQPTPQRLDKAPPTSALSGSKPGVTQPTPQALAKPSGGSSILVSPRQRGNPVLTALKSIPWEYSDIPADYVLGLTTCALFLSLKYHRLHPEYIYTRIRNLQGKYNLRIVLTMVDIPNHEDPLRELSKTSLVNGVTLLLCWSAAEAARYLELYKAYENAAFTAIKGQQASTYADRLTDFVTVPRSLNKSDAIALVANFGSLRNAINAEQEALGMISGWGGTKVKRWVTAVEEPFRVKKTAKRGVRRDESTVGGGDRTDVLHEARPLARVPLREMSTTGAAKGAASTPAAKQYAVAGDVSDSENEEEAMMAAAMEESRRMAEDAQRKSQGEHGKNGEEASGSGLTDGVAAALAKLRDGS
ncbi:DNA repair protein rad10 [Emericellopsis atlantica]|uniref:DNA repair protein rad10 n=1 Tax=Emericellopsis atlantica TaxID=2614577 RepID=A0A9P7ZSG8_9HYPO|nr:DNA repair protein rad10 [Emericellopsis atlantica]KAG9256833.1 DNA repair protein rad10 [Emericellopsis atlantica]